MDDVDYSTFCDDRGELVIRYALDDIRDDLDTIIGENTFFVEGLINGDPDQYFYGTGYVKDVINIVPVGSGGSK